MAASSKPIMPAWFNLIVWLYNKSIFLYPKTFQENFGYEMRDVFYDLLWETRQNSILALFNFLGREFITAPKTILHQHLEANSFWLRPYPVNLLAFMIGFTLLGYIEQGEFGNHKLFFNLLGFIFIGGLFGLAIGIGSISNRKKQYVFGGVVGFVLANTVVKQSFFILFPSALSSSGTGAKFLIPFLYPLLIGSVFGLFIGGASGNWRGLFRWTMVGSMAMLAGFFVNRLFAALMLSYVFSLSPEAISQSGGSNLLIYLSVPYLLEGLVLGSIFGKSTKRKKFIQV